MRKCLICKTKSDNFLKGFLVCNHCVKKENDKQGRIIDRLIKKSYIYKKGKELVEEKEEK